MSTEAVTALDIAKKLNRAHSSVYAAMKRLEIQPMVESAAGIKLYSTSAIEVLEREMRAPNGAKGQDN